MAIIIAGLHYFGFAIAFTAYIARMRWLKQASNGNIIDTLKGSKTIHIFLALGLFLSVATGFYRLFGGLDKAVAFYMKNGLFHAKLGLVFVLIIVEIVCVMMTMRWSKQQRQKQNFRIENKSLKTMKVLYMVMIHAFAAIPFLAAAITRGVGL